jgi:hypothetical protein
MLWSERGQTALESVFFQLSNKLLELYFKGPHSTQQNFLRFKLHDSHHVINGTTTILGIFRRRVFYLKLNSTLQVFPYLTGNITSPLQSQQVNAIYRFVSMVY